MLNVDKTDTFNLFSIILVALFFKTSAIGPRQSFFLILSLILILILILIFFRIRVLYNWVKKQCPHCKIEDMEDSFSDGKVLGALMKRLCPEFEYDMSQERDPEEVRKERNIGR